MSTLRALALLGCALGLVASAAASGTVRRVPPVVATGLRVPDDVAVAPGEPRRLYVVEQRGTIRIAVGGHTLPHPFLDLRRLVKTSLLQGLFSIAFHPHYARDRRFYVDYVGNDGRVKVVEYRSRAGRALPGSARILLDLDVGRDHYGGELVFGPDGKLYVGVGDGDVAGDAQNPASPRGKILRLDVDEPDSTPELVALGLRNPWRFSFDRKTGAMLIGDVGADAWEEIDFLSAHSLNVPNYGWNLYEGRQRTEASPLDPAPVVTGPILAYRNPKKRCAAVVGGFVYRGRGSPRLRGRYVYGDLCSASIWSFRLARGKAVDRRLEPLVVPGGTTSFGEGASGQLYATSLEGKVYLLAS
jgi:glucose/arabinose dehydrogenase